MQRRNLVAAATIVLAAAALVVIALNAGDFGTVANVVSIAMVVLAVGSLAAASIVGPQQLAGMRDARWAFGSLVILATVAIAVAFSGLLLAAAAVAIAILASAVGWARAPEAHGGEGSSSA
jgi:hypothetical protein